MVCAFYYLFIVYYKPDYSGYYFNAKVNVVDLEPSYWKYIPFDEVQLCQIKLVATSDQASKWKNARNVE